MNMKPLIKKGLVVGIILSFIGTCILPTTAQDMKKAFSASRGNWLYVGGSGPGNYTRIQDAIDDASDGDTVFVYDELSPYYGNIKINKSITLLGENRDTTIIDANGSGCPVNLEANNITVCSFTLQNSGNKDYNDAGIHFKNWGDVPYSNNNRITGNTIRNNYDGIFGINSENNDITDNIIINNRHCGIFFQAGCTSCILRNNTIMGNDYGVSIQDTNYVQVIENTIATNNEIGVYLFAGADLNLVKNNYITNNSYGIVLDAGPYGAGWNTILSNTIANNSKFGLYLFQGYWCKIHKNNFIGNTMHASFFYMLPIKMIAPFFGHFFQMNKFYRNYWDDTFLIAPKVIQGEMLCFYFLSNLYEMELIHIPIQQKTVQWMNFDWFPALKPYDILGVN